MKKEYERPVADIVRLIPQQSVAHSDDGDRDRRASSDIIISSPGVNTGGRV